MIWWSKSGSEAKTGPNRWPQLRWVCLHHLPIWRDMEGLMGPQIWGLIRGFSWPVNQNGGCAVQSSSVRGPIFNPIGTRL